VYVAGWICYHIAIKEQVTKNKEQGLKYVSTCKI